MYDLWLTQRFVKKLTVSWPVKLDVEWVMRVGCFSIVMEEVEFCMEGHARKTPQAPEGTTTCERVGWSHRKLGAKTCILKSTLRRAFSTKHLKAILRQNFYERYVEARGLRDSCDTLICVWGDGDLFDKRIRVLR